MPRDGRAVAPRSPAARLVAATILCVALTVGVDSRAQTVVRDGAFEFTVAPAPAWVKLSPPVKPRPPGTNVPGGVATLVSDRQYRYDASPVSYVRFAIMPVDANGLGSVSHLQVEFNPAFQKLVLHDIVVERAGVRTTRLDTGRVRLIQRERDLERRMYDGTVTATLVLDDVRVGDVVDYAYSIEGANTLYPDKVVATFPAGHGEPVGYMRTRLVTDAARPVRARTLVTPVEPTRTVDGQFQDWTWERHDVPAVDLMEDAPPRVAQVPLVVFSEIDSWADVVGWAEPLYRSPPELPAELVERVAAWRARSDDPRKRALLALRFVQTEIRYFGVELGYGSLQPRAPSETMRSGFGDCKDKSMLLVAALRAMDIDARPVLVSIRFGRLIDRMLPSPKLFDHMIVRVSVGTKDYWLDPTLTTQGGDLEAASVQDYGSILPVAPGTTGLVALDPSKAPPFALERTETIALRTWSDPADLTIETMYRGQAANLARALYAMATPDNIDRGTLDLVHRRYKQASLERPVEVADDRDANRLTVTSRMRVPGIVTRSGDVAGVLVVATGVSDFAPINAPRSRKIAYALPFPADFRHRTVIDFPEAVRSVPADGVRIADGSFTFDRRVELKDRRFTFDASWKSVGGEVQPAEWPTYIAKLDDMRRLLVYGVDTAPLAKPGFLGLLLSPTPSYVHDHREKREAVERLTKVIVSGRLAGNELAEAYQDRGVQYSNLGLYDEALFDLDKAVALRPDAAAVHNDRALVLASQGKFAAADAEFARAQALDPRDAHFPYMRGIYAYQSGDFAAADRHLRAALDEAAPGRGNYILLWLTLTTTRLGRDASALPPADRSKLDPSSWPYPIVRYYRGEIAEAAVFDEARVRDPKESLFNACEAGFFVGQHWLVRGDAARARRYFEQAKATDVREYIEWRAAVLELSKLP